MNDNKLATRNGRPLGAPLIIASLLALGACSTPEPEQPPLAVAEPGRPASELIREALGKVTLDAATKGQEVLGAQVTEDRGVVSLRYGGPADRYVVCDNAAWLAPGGGAVDVNLSKNIAFETIDDKGEPVSIERWVRLDALTNVVVRAENQQAKIEPQSHYILSMVTEVYNLNQRIGHKAERLEFDSAGSALTSTGHRCQSTGALEKLDSTRAS